MAGHGDGNRAIIAAFGANLGIAIAKFVGFAFTGSASMLAESIHSVADTGNQGLLLLGGRRSKRAPDRAFQFGYGRERYFWSFVVALVLFSLGAAFAVYEGAHKIQHPEPVDDPVWAYAILGLAVLLEAFSLRTAVKESAEARGRRTWWRFIREAKSPELPVVLLEDLGAQLGLMVALTAVTVSEITGEPVWDGIGTVVIGLLLGVIAIVLAIEMKGLLIGEAADPGTQARIEDALRSDPRVRALIHVRTQHLGPEELLVAAKVEFDHDLSGPELALAIDEVEARVRAAAPIVRLLFVEPDVARSEAS